MSNLQDPSCIDCGSGGEIHQHHVVPRSLGGTFMVPLCSSCHALVHGLKKLHVGRLTKKAMQAKRKRGEFTGGGVPYGQRVSDDGIHIEADEGEQAVIAAVVEYRAAGLSLRAIAERLQARGFTTRKGGRFAASQVSRIIEVAAYQDETEVPQ